MYMGVIYWQLKFLRIKAGIKVFNNVYYNAYAKKL